MKTPICEIDARTDSLCRAHEQALAAGEISQADVKISRILYEHKESAGLENASLAKAIETNTALILITDESPGVLIGKGGETVKRLSKAYGKRIRIIQRSPDLHLMIEEVLQPARATGINSLFKDGKEHLRVRIPKKEAAKLPYDLDSLKKLLGALSIQDVNIVFE